MTTSFPTSSSRGLTTLDRLEPGEQATIFRVEGHDGIASRLRELGFVSGQPITFLRAAPLGDPLKCSIQGALVAVRGAEARRVWIEPLSASLPGAVA